eukprot:CAMPEP_0194083698 /NCGR_PEP_ID=MMETSP0149-20130528/9711_1 /TAXON_ID=122233 /ORGANISM="Chaetoceros debilis, Strain MM31A-1" /LENGTH=307 /DNA_ID=CAMNT_0038766147 /DNA_START=31 /DNA_END=955 /DNA_ORIENTATION=-
MKIAITPLIAAALFGSANAFSVGYLDQMSGGGTVEKYTPPPVKTPVASNDYLSNMAGISSPAPSYPTAPAPVAPAASAPAAAAAAPAASGPGMASFADQMSGGSVEKYTPPPVKAPAAESGYLSNMAGSSAAAPAAPAPVAAAPAPVAAAPAPVVAAPVKSAVSFTPLPETKTVGGDYLGALLGNAPTLSGSGPAGYLDALATESVSLRGPGMTTYIDTMGPAAPTTYSAVPAPVAAVPVAAAPSPAAAAPVAAAPAQVAAAAFVAAPAASSADPGASVVQTTPMSTTTTTNTTTTTSTTTSTDVQN